jgi:Ca2+-binding RTX toxin-like protein
MIIDVKGTRRDGDASEAPARQRYLEREIKLSKTPLAVGAFLFGIAAYLKSALPSKAQPEGEPDPAAAFEPDGPHLKLVESGLAPAGKEEATGALQEENGKPRPVGSGSLLDERLPSAAFMAVESNAIDFSDFYVQRSDVSEFAVFQAALTVANDNIRSARRPSASGGSSGDSAEPDSPESPVAGVGEGDEGKDRSKGGTKGRDKNKGKDKDEEDDPENRAPCSTGPLYLADLLSCASVLFGLSTLLANASDPDGDALTIRNLTVSSGTITQSGTGWLYDPDSIGPVTIRYEITDGKASITQYAYFSVEKSAPIHGSEGDDIIVGTSCGDTIDALGGDDLVDGRSGDDVIHGRSGNDHITGGAGSDVILGGEGDDVIFGQFGDDQISGGAGDDRLFGDEGSDIVFGDAGDDEIHGGEGNDLLSGGAGCDTVLGGVGDDNIRGDGGDDSLDGGDGNDLIAAGIGNDSLEGGAGADVLIDEAGQDTVIGGLGDDHVIVALDEDRDVYAGAEGIDTLDLTATTGGVDVDVADHVAEGQEIGHNEIGGFEIVEGGWGDDVLAGAGSSDTFSGGAGDDRIDGRGGDDAIDGGAGNDFLVDGAGQDSMTGGTGDDHVRAAADGESDVYRGGDGGDTLDYSQSGQSITVDLVAMVASGTEIGEDMIESFEAVIGGSGDDSFLVGPQAVILEGGGGNDLFEFVPPPPMAEPVLVHHEIVDFQAGDRIRMSKYDIFEKIIDQLESQFEAIYGDTVDADKASIRYRYETAENLDRTVLEADLDRDRTYETTVILEGRHALVIIDHT